MASSVLSQTVFLPQQVAMAVSHLAGRTGGARSMSTQKHNKLAAGRRDLDREQPNNLQSVPSFEEMNTSKLSELLCEAHAAVTTPTTALIQRARRSCRKWEESHISGASFFENRTGFPAHSQEPVAHSLHKVVRDPLFRRIFNSLAQSHYSQRRGFKTRRAGKRMSTHESQVGGDKFLAGIQDMFDKSKSSSKSGSQPLGGFSVGSESVKSAESTAKPDEQNSLLARVFREGYKAGEEKADELKRQRYKVIFYLCLFLYLLYEFGPVKIQSGGLSSLFSEPPPEVNTEEVNVTFDDVRGAAEAKKELQDVVNFLRDPDKYTALGAKLPKGVLLVGPPGVGKTLLARAVAGEAGVPFFQASGSDFDEMFVGVGAKRIRELFTAAKDVAPCIIFIDEFDSVGSKRTASAVHPYANQTVNQLLNEMDGFQQNEGIIVMGATNKVENLDKALRRPGRFDVEVTVSLPDLKDRKEIIELYFSKIKKDSSVDADELARGTTGFSGAELENLVNQAALKAVIDGRETVTMAHLNHARDKILMGPERKHRIPDEETNWITAFHEAGHTLVAYYTKDATPLHKVTIIPRGQSLGHTAFIDDKEVYNRTLSQMKASMDVSMGGRAAEEIIYGVDKVTTGASSDFQSSTKVAEAMVMACGMSEKVGLRVFSESDVDLSPSQREAIDSEIKRLLQESYDRARAILNSHRKELDALAKNLIKYETLDKDDIKTVIEGKTLNGII